MRKGIGRVYPLIILALCIAAVCPQYEGAAPERTTFYRDVLPILQENCQECHRPAGANLGGMVAPMSLTSYEETRPWAKSIVQQITSKEMPPWDADESFHGVFANERSLTDEEIATITRWVELGAPRGNTKDAPPPVEFTSVDGWLIGEPDLVVAMPEPYFVSDDVSDQYTAFSVDLTEVQLPENAWITAFQCKPGSPIIHHFNCHLLAPANGKLPPPRGKPESNTISPEGAGQYIGGVSSGSDASKYPEGFGLPLKKGTRVTFDIHYHKEPGPGTAVTDLSHIGFKLSKTPPTRALGGIPPMMHFAIDIPPAEANHQIGPISHTLREPVDIIALMPHMHMRGDKAKFEAFYPNGTSEVLLYVPKYDFSWQTVYYYNELKRIPAGTRVEYTAWYDNSPEMAEARGFDSNQNVHFGQKSTDEMMMGFVMGSVVPQDEIE